MSDIWIPTSLADLMDRVAILQVKLMHLDGEKRKIVKRQHGSLIKILIGQAFEFEDLKELEEINLVLWKLEDGVRKDANLPDYRDVTYWNDQRALVKQQIDEKAGSELREVKSYV